MLHKLAAVLERAQEAALDAAAEALGVALREWGASKAMQLALIIVKRGLSHSLNALNKIKIDNRRDLLTLLAPAWVNVRAAEPLWRYAKPAAKPVLVINGKLSKTAEHYVARAWSHTWDEDWGVVPVTSKSTGMDGTFEEDVLRAYWIKRMDQEVTGEQWSPETARAARDAIKAGGAANLPLYFSVTHTEGFDPEELVKVQSAIPEATILYLCNQQLPATVDFLETTPPLSLQAEGQAITDYQVAFGALAKR